MSSQKSGTAVMHMHESGSGEGAKRKSREKTGKLRSPRCRVPGPCPVEVAKEGPTRVSTACTSCLAADANCTQALWSLGHPEIQLLRTHIHRHAFGNSEYYAYCSPDLPSGAVQIVRDNEADASRLMHRKHTSSR